MSCFNFKVFTYAFQSWLKNFPRRSKTCWHAASGKTSERNVRVFITVLLFVLAILVGKSCQTSAAFNFRCLPTLSFISTPSRCLAVFLNEVWRGIYFWRTHFVSYVKSLWKRIETEAEVTLISQTFILSVTEQQTDVGGFLNSFKIFTRLGFSHLANSFFVCP